MEYGGRAQLGDGERAVEAVVQIPDVEDPEWFAVIIDGSPASSGEVAVTLLDGDLYNAWRGSALVTRNGGDGRVRLLGLVPFTPPVGA